MAKMVAIGPEQFALPFGVVGFALAEAGPEDFLAELRKHVADRSVGLIACPETLVAAVDQEEFEELASEGGAAVLVLPDGPEAQQIGLEMFRRRIERAAGVDLLASAPGEGASVSD